MSDQPMTARPEAQAAPKLTAGQINARANHALDIIGKLSRGDLRWTMSVPADPENDPDLLLSATIRELQTLALASLHAGVSGDAAAPENWATRKFTIPPEAI